MSTDTPATGPRPAEHHPVIDDVPEGPGEAVEERQGRTLARRAFAIAGVSALAVAQPLLDLFGNNPEFFVAGNYSTAQIVWFALLIVAVPPLVGIALTAVAMLIDRRAGTVVFATVIAVFGAAFVLALLRSAGTDSAAVVFLLALAGGTLVAWLVVRTTGGKLLASYLSAANVAFLFLFLFASPTADLVSGASSGAVGTVAMPDLGGPVVVIILDEFPAASIITPDGDINEERYPGFAELARVSTWFRNASSQYNLTHQAVPSILDGRLGEEGSLPIYADHPRNLFTLFGGSVPVHRYESVTDMCPTSICDPQPTQPLSQAIEDATIVYGHRLLPAALRDRLPAIDNSWGGYGAQDDAGGVTGGTADAASEPASSGSETPSLITEAYSKWQGLDADERSPLGQAAILRSSIDEITAEPALHFVHVALPHRPWILSRTGVSTSWAPELVLDEADPAYAFENRMEFQFSAMQIGAADSLVAELLDQLRALPNWDDTLLVVTSDHGTNLTPPDLGRMHLTDENIDEAMRVPLFVKAPGQALGGIDDRVVLNIDVLPSIVDLVDAEVDWEFDGHSLYDGSEPTLDPRVSPDVQALFDIAARREAAFPHGADWIGLAAVGDNGDLIGRRVAGDGLDVGDASAFTISIDQADQFASLPTEAGQMPFGMAGTVRGDDDPPELVVAVNGRLAGVLGGYRPVRGGWSFMGYVADVFDRGANEVVVYEVERVGGVVTLHPVGQT